MIRVLLALLVMGGVARAQDVAPRCQVASGGRYCVLRDGTAYWITATDQAQPYASAPQCQIDTATGSVSSCVFVNHLATWVDETVNPSVPVWTGTAVASTIYVNGTSSGVALPIQDSTSSATIRIEPLGQNPGPVYVNGSGDLYTPKRGNGMMEFLGYVFCALVAVGLVAAVVAITESIVGLFKDVNKAFSKLDDLSERLDDLEGLNDPTEEEIAVVLGIAPTLTKEEASAIIKAL